MNIGIEYQGVQHFKPVDYFGGKEAYIETIERDIRKNKICKENKLDILYFTYNMNHLTENYPFKVLTKIQDLLELIQNKLNQNEIRLERHNNSSL